MNYEALRVERSESVGIVFLNRPEKLNALNVTLRRELVEATSVLVDDDSVKALVFTGSGDKAFAAGADVREFAVRSTDEQRDSLHRYPICEAVYECPKPTIAAVHGYCLGGGCELALSCDLRIADRSAQFGQPEIRLGLIPGGGGTQRLSRLVGPGQALRLCLSGDPIDAEEAHRIGLVELLVDEGEHLEKALEVAGRMTRWSSRSLRLVKESVHASVNNPLSHGLEIERKLFLEAFASEDGRKGVRTFIERQEARATDR